MAQAAISLVYFGTVGLAVCGFVGAAEWWMRRRERAARREARVMRRAMRGGAL